MNLKQLFFLPPRRLASSKVKLKKTALWDLHKSLNAKMGPFAGWDMPMIYKELTQRESTAWTREKCSVFDVSHMLQTRLTGANAIAAIESICTADVAGLRDNAGCLSLFTNESGGILDDLIVNKISNDEIYIVSNASMAEQDFGLLSDAAKRFNVDLCKIETSLIAVQGPESAKILQSGTPTDLSNIFFMDGADVELFDVPNIRLTRCGYTGEDGFELSVPSQNVEKLVEKILDKGGKMAGLAARDSLRLEAGLCLYGNDIDTTTLPPSAVLLFTVPKKRRADGNFPGCAQIIRQQKEKPEKKRVGLVFEGKIPAREGANLLNLDDEEVGKVTSGGPSFTLEKNIGMGYVPLALSKPGTELKVQVRKNRFAATVTKMPFVPAKYYFAK